MPNWCGPERKVAKFHFLESWDIQGRAVQLACIPGRFFQHPAFPHPSPKGRKCPRLPVILPLIIATSCPNEIHTSRSMQAALWVTVKAEVPAAPSPSPLRSRRPHHHHHQFWFQLFCELPRACPFPLGVSISPDVKQVSPHPATGLAFETDPWK